jgi:oligopeptide/dipeptide ABC transporter ATP-binding protein
VSQTLLSIQDLVTVFPGPDKPLAAVDGVSLDLNKGEILGLVGESGCGKTMTALSVLKLVPPPGRIAAGQVLFKGEDLDKVSLERLRKIRGAEISMIFQEPMTSLNPVFTIGRQLTELLLAHDAADPEEALKRSIEMLGKVGISEAARRVKDYPHQFSGGMRQRVMIAMALLMNPSLVIADEPTTALDVTIQAQILGLMKHLQKETGAAILLITHNLAVVAQVAQRAAVMYTGRIVEEASVKQLYNNPLHPYTQGLLSCLPSRSEQRQQTLHTIPGTVPALDALPRGCAFADRCPQVMAKCKDQEPKLVETESGHKVRCYLHHDQARPPRAQLEMEAA